MKQRYLVICGVALVLLISSCRSVQVERSDIHAQIDELILEKEYEEAERKAKEYLTNYPDEAEAICALACVYRNKALKSAVNVNTDVMGIKEGESGSYEINESSDIEKLFTEVQYYDEDEYKKAEELYLKSIRVNPSYTNAYFNLLNDYVLMAKYDKYFHAIDLFVKNLKHDDATPYQLNDLAGKLSQNESYDQAQRLYSLIIENYPDFHEAHSDLGVLYSRQGKYVQAQDIFQSVYEKAPADLINLKNYYFS